uniref:Peptidase A1 domain-containing protein n=1 Tax=Alexandrium catenella TaxID=2925 RepID=A0A7S1RWP9_ALECA|mmetsp:Transcript_75669/g.201026  ORF Transcript_75669/g.201026 Transcript_75669/m.201026 type:complete len:486 (+) Transcript_75669:75-1532(+)|eukprot:CAMPEP_0171206542 /NCGR_PEP_ID=MMETSP0790-20130122/27117_1 /TAXON_ID=2925 /ORGANISM="Alexandrium catenella, Strain OF101" /LENGTH=485 /DNA_ID=CAMNT_0011672091 /DNA_START=75 /DNA_END=1532 /DNA_ORIENTATION=-
MHCAGAVVVALVSVTTAAAHGDDSTIEEHWQPGGIRLQQEQSRGRQELFNFKDLQYYAELSVGTPRQKLTGVIDTGSFELVLFSKTCEDCGRAGSYDSNASSSHRAGALVNSLTYGSGEVQANHSCDEFVVGPFPPKEQCFWEGLSADMPLLENAKFQAIIGIGPPETPAADAWAFTVNSLRHINRHFKKHLGEQLPDDLVVQANQDLSTALQISRAKPVLSNFEVTMFSVCLGKRPGSSGFFVWNDTAALRQPDLFYRLPVVGKHTWTVQMSAVHLSERVPMPSSEGVISLPGCADGCSAVIDSGTSLLVMPTATIDALVSMLNGRVGPGCGNLHQLPDIAFSLNGVEVSLPPDAYMGQVSGSMPAYINDVIRVRRLRLHGKERQGEQCEVAVMESFTQTDHGPLWVLGMPFFRKYYTTFDVGSNASERSIHLALASDACTPMSPEVPVAVAERKEAVQRREIDLTHVMPPSILRQVRKDFLHT